MDDRAREMSVVDGFRLHHPLFGGKFVRLFTHADGSCFFHALACALNWRGYRDASHVKRVRLGRELRAKVVTRANWDAFLEELGVSASALEESGLSTFEQAQDYRQDADDMIWNLTARTLGLCILVVRDVDTIFTSSPGDVASTSPIVIMAWVNGNHFEPLVETDVLAEPMFSPPFRESLKKSLLVVEDGDAESAAEQAEMAIHPSSMRYVGVFSTAHEIVRKVLRLRSR